MDFKGTKGKWIIRGNMIINESIICDVYKNRTEEGRANSCLISQAPNLLKSLQKLVKSVGNPWDLEGLSTAVKEAEEVIKKALGNG